MCAKPPLSPEIDKAVRMALVPRLADDADSDLAKFSTPADGFGALGSLASNEVPVSVTTLKPSALEKIQEFLIRGERKQACHYALDQKLWAHAMVIASSTDRDAWQEVVKEFIRAELGSNEIRDDKSRPSDPRRGSLPTGTLNGRESLGVAYSLFAGQGAASGIIIYLASCSNSRLIFYFSSSNASPRSAFSSDRQQTCATSVNPSWCYAHVPQFRSQPAHERPRRGSSEMGRDCCNDDIQSGVT